MKKEKFTPELIEQLNENEVFVFGSNKAGNHAGGAARTAVEKFGAVMGQGEGIQGQSYAIPTLDENMEKVSLDDLQQSLFRFCQYAEKESEKTSVEKTEKTVQKNYNPTIQKAYPPEECADQESWRTIPGII